MRLRFSEALIMGAALAVSSLAHATALPKATTTSVPAKTVPAKTSGSAVSSSVKSSSTPATLTTINSPITIDALAKVEAILAYCGTVDKTNASQYSQALSNITAGHSLAEIRNDQSSSRYVSTLGSMNAQLAALPAGTVVTSCKNFLAGL
jgi:hypothetical protein